MSCRRWPSARSRNVTETYKCRKKLIFRSHTLLCVKESAGVPLTVRWLPAAHFRAFALSPSSMYIEGAKTH